MFYSFIVGVLGLLTVYCLMRFVFALRHGSYRSAVVSLLAALAILVLIFAPAGKPVVVTLPVNTSR